MGDASTQSNDQYTQMACALMNTLLANPEGVRYLNEDKFLSQLAECLAQLDPAARVPPTDVVVFSKHRMETTMAAGYFEMLGTLSKNAEGLRCVWGYLNIARLQRIWLITVGLVLRMIEQLRIFTTFYSISELRNRDDLVKAILANMDYSHDGHARVLLSRALTASHKVNWR